MNDEIERPLSPDGDSASAKNVEGAPTSMWPILCHLGRVFMSLMSDLWDVAEALFFAAFNLLVGLCKVANNLWCNWVKPNWKSDDWHGKAAVIELFIIVPLILLGLIFGRESSDEEDEGKERRTAVECRVDAEDGPSVWDKIRSAFSTEEQVRWMCKHCGNQVRVKKGNFPPYVFCPERPMEGSCRMSCVWIPID